MTSKGYVQDAEHVRKRMEAKARTLALRGPKKPDVRADTLRRWYHGGEMTLKQIGQRVGGRDAKTVLGWMRFYGIPTRPRGSNRMPPGYFAGEKNPFFGKKHTKKTRARLRALSLADGRLPWGKNNPPYNRGRKGPLSVNWKGGLTPERQAFYGTDEWKAAVVAVWYRADARCERCKVHHNTAKRRGTFHVHHIISFVVASLRAEVSNLALLCRPCHLFVHSSKNVSRVFLKDHKEHKWRFRTRK